MAFVDELFGMTGKSALVTGGTRGIGLAIAEGFVRAGARVYICSRDADACTSAAGRLQSFGTCIAFPCDISSTEGRHALIEKLKAYETSLNVLVNNAGAMWAAPLTAYPESGWDKVFDLNLKACFFLIKEILPMLQAAATAADPARIINVGSINALRIPTHETYAYVSSKAALHHLTRHLAGQLARHSITANVIAPGLYPSKMLAKDIERKGMEELTASIPLRRLANMTDMAGAALYLSSKAGSFLTGAVIPVDGGMASTI